MSDTPAAAPARRFRPLLLAGCLAALLAFATAAGAQTWNESGDAGDLVATAQVTNGTGPLQVINGNLASPADVDLYCIRLPAVPPAGLPIVTLQCVVDTGPNVFLFDAAGNGVYVNMQCMAGNKTLLAPNTSLAPGTYYVAVAYTGVDAQSAGGAIWLPGPGQKSPDGPGAAGTLVGWSGTGMVQPQNPYQLTLSFMQYCSAATATARPTWGSLKSYYR